MPPSPLSASSSPSSPARGNNSEREKRLNILRASVAELESQVVHLETRAAEVKAQLKEDPTTTVQRHIQLLHDYNEIKDIGQGLMGLIADARGVRQVDIQRDFGVGDRD